MFVIAPSILSADFTRLGAEITATAVLAEVEGRKLTFNVGARDAEGLIGEGIHIRYIVDREKFMAKVK